MTLTRLLTQTTLEMISLSQCEVPKGAPFPITDFIIPHPRQNQNAKRPLIMFNKSHHNASIHRIKIIVPIVWPTEPNKKHVKTKTSTVKKDTSQHFFLVIMIHLFCVFYK